MENEEDLETLEEMEPALELPEEIPEEVVSQPSPRKQVDQLLDGTGSNALQKMGVPKKAADHAIKTNGGALSPNNLPGNHLIKNKSRDALAKSPMFQNKNGNDVNRLQQALNKNHQNLPNFHNQNQDQENESGGIGKTLDKVGEKSVEKFGGAAITALSGGAISGPAADAAAKVVAKPAGKMLKYTLLVTFLPLFFIVFFCFSIFIAILSDDVKDSANSSNSSESSISSGGVCSYKTPKGTISNMKIRLKKCHNGNPSGKYGDLIQDELLDFEYYILGVVYQEINVATATPEAIKAQAIAARNYTITRNNYSRIKNEDGQTIIEMYACTDDQAFCDPDTGCHSDSVGGEHSTTIYPGSTGGSWRKPPLKSQKVRDIVAETEGQVVISPKGNLVGTNFCSPETDLFTDYGKEGLNAFEILKKVYDGSSHYQASGCGTGVRPRVSTMSSNCVDDDAEEDKMSKCVNKEAKKWKQFDSKWGNQLLGTSKTSTIRKAGCAATSVSIQLACSGVKTTFDNLNPGTFVKEYTKKGGFSGALIYFQNISKVAPNFQYIAKTPVSGSASEKARKLQGYLDNNEYIVIGVHQSKSDSITHYVALNRVSRGQVLIYDPGKSVGNKLFVSYPYTITRDIIAVRYRVS